MIKDKRRLLINNVCKFLNCKNKWYVILIIYVLMIYKIYGIYVFIDYYLFIIKFLKKFKNKICNNLVWYYWDNFINFLISNILNRFFSC